MTSTATVAPPHTPSTTPRARFSSRISTNRFGLLLVAPVVLLTVVIVIYPVAYSLWISLTSSNPITGRSRFVGLENYATALGSGEFWRTLTLTLF